MKNERRTEACTSHVRADCAVRSYVIPVLFRRSLSPEEALEGLRPLVVLTHRGGVLVVGCLDGTPGVVSRLPCVLELLLSCVAVRCLFGRRQPCPYRLVASDRVPEDVHLSTASHYDQPLSIESGPSLLSCAYRTHQQKDGAYGKAIIIITVFLYFVNEPLFEFKRSLVAWLEVANVGKV